MEGQAGTGEVTIRRAREADARLLQAWSALPELQRHQPMVPMSLGEVRRSLRRLGAGSLTEERGHSLRWIIEEDGVAAGWVTLRNISWEHRSAMIGYSVAPWAQRRRVGTRGVSMVLDLAFGPGRLKRVEADCDVDNLASQRLLERLGFQQEGRLRSLVQMPGGRRDYYLYSLLSEEWHR
jgi:RimJ/RimL family protein N-acetyltransferase